MPLTPARRIAFRLLASMLLLLIVYSTLHLADAVNALPLEFLLPMPAFPSATVLRDLVLLTGLFASAIVLVCDERHDGDLRHTHLLGFLAQGWTGWVCLAVIGAVLPVDWRSYGLFPVVDVLFAIGWVALLALSVPRRDLRLALLLLAVGLCAAGASVRLHLGVPLASAALGFWLMHRFSNVTPGWAALGIRSVGGLLTLSGLLGLLAPIDALAGYLSAGAIPFAAMIYAAHSHRALSDPNPNRTLAAYWFAFGLVLFLLANGTLTALFSVPVLWAAVRDTAFDAAQAWLSAWALIALLLALLNQVSAEQRGENRRVTGLLPYWCVLFGTLGAGLAWCALGLAESLLRQAGLGTADIHAYSVALVWLKCFGLLVQLAGLMLYAVGFWARRPIASG